MWEGLEEEIWKAGDIHRVSAVCCTALGALSCISLNLYSNVWTRLIFPILQVTVGELFNSSELISGRAGTGDSQPLGNAAYESSTTWWLQQSLQADCREPLLWRDELRIWVPEGVISNCKAIPAGAWERKSKGVISVGWSSSRQAVKREGFGGSKETDVFVSRMLGVSWKL